MPPIFSSNGPAGLQIAAIVLVSLLGGSVLLFVLVTLIRYLIKKNQQRLVYQEPKFQNASTLSFMSDSTKVGSILPLHNRTSSGPNKLRKSHDRSRSSSFYQQSDASTSGPHLSRPGSMPTGSSRSLHIITSHTPPITPFTPSDETAPWDPDYYYKYSPATTPTKKDTPPLPTIAILSASTDGYGSPSSAITPVPAIPPQHASGKTPVKFDFRKGTSPPTLPPLFESANEPISRENPPKSLEKKTPGPTTVVATIKTTPSITSIIKPLDRPPQPQPLRRISTHLPSSPKPQQEETKRFSWDPKDTSLESIYYPSSSSISRPSTAPPTAPPSSAAANQPTSTKASGESTPASQDSAITRTKTSATTKSMSSPVSPLEYPGLVERWSKTAPTEKIAV